MLASSSLADERGASTIWSVVHSSQAFPRSKTRVAGTTRTQRRSDHARGVIAQRSSLEKGRGAERRSALPGLSADKEVAPVVGLDLDVVLLRGLRDASPRLVSFRVADSFDLIETRDGVA